MINVGCITLVHDFKKVETALTNIFHSQQVLVSISTYNISTIQYDTTDCQGGVTVSNNNNIITMYAYIRH